uniref:Amino acid transporter n=1 Tax=Schistocephalus solidus TaxID=70667 RepID=A0A0X3P4B3_SCHSO
MQQQTPSVLTKDSDIEVSSQEDDRKKLRNPCVRFLCDNLFMLLTLVGVAVGFGVGFGAKRLPDLSIAETWIKMPGDLYIRLLQLAILPLISSNLIIVIAKLEPKEQGRSGLLCLLFILGYNIISSALGTALAVLINPGGRYNGGNTTVNQEDSGLQPTTSDIFANLFYNLIPENIVQMTIFQVATEYTLDNSTDPPSKVRNQVLHHTTDMIGVLFVSIVFGLAARVAGDRSKPFLDFFSSVADVVLVLIRWFLVLTPIGVCFMIAGAIMPVDDIQGTFAGLGFFILCVVVGCVINSIVTFLLFLVFTRRNPFKFFRYCVKAWIVAFATTSPIVSIPEMYQGCDDYGVDKDISRFTCPLVTTLKADGPAIFISSAAMFVTQFTLGSAPAGTAVVIWLLTSASVFAIPHIPSASIVITITILSSLGVSTQAASLLYAVDWFLDRLRCVTAIISNMYTVAIIDHHQKNRKKKLASETAPSIHSFQYINDI